MANLGKALSKQHIVSIINELLESKSLSVHISRSKTLVWQELPRLYDSKHLLPLLRSWVNSSWIMSTGMEEDDGSLRDG